MAPGALGTVGGIFGILVFALLAIIVFKRIFKKHKGD